ncbi:recombinase family protein [Labilibaculum sp. DW002]|uniref:Recombinase family protein n=1 Tax=Paralabilibaculum antarcticum TaxID=2912572 RepID=A0ABT5VUP4_9BACT|nr:recombinase family protein [Labilibaculum sp. DW002]MDE5419137.1 recombinase family protein [Labilibaculum sp. DW002]
MDKVKKGTYVRASTEEQNTERQEQIIQGKGYVEKISGRIAFAERKQGARLLRDVANKEINYVIVEDVSRLGRNALDILTTIQTLKKQGCTIEILRYSLVSMVKGKANFIFDLITSILASLAEMEYESNREAQRQGIAVAKAKGIYQQHAGKGKMTDEQFLEKHADIIELLEDGKSIMKIVALVKKSKSTVQRVKKFIETLAACFF